MACVQACGEGHPECPEGNVCSMGICSQSCEPEDAGGCHANFRCNQFGPQKPWICAPNW
jgi:hypothetical protein